MKRFLVFTVLCLLSHGVMAADATVTSGTVTTTEVTHTSVKSIAFAWTSDSGGDVVVETGNYYDGEILAVTTDPGITSPTASYDVILNDGDTLDVLLGAAVNRHATTTEYLLKANLGAVTTSKLTLRISSAGAAKVGVIKIWIR